MCYIYRYRLKPWDMYVWVNTYLRVGAYIYTVCRKCNCLLMCGCVFKREQALPRRKTSSGRWQRVWGQTLQWLCLSKLHNVFCSQSYQKLLQENWNFSSGFITSCHWLSAQFCVIWYTSVFPPWSSLILSSWQPLGWRLWCISQAPYQVFAGFSFHIC